MSVSSSAAGQEQLLRWVACLGPVTADAIAIREGCSLAQARGRLAAGRRAGVLARYALLAGRPALYAITREGLRACAVRGSLPPCPTAAGAAHAAACAHVAAALEREFPGHRVVGEPMLRRAPADGGLGLDCTPAPARSARGPCRHRGDLALLDVRHRRLPVVVEVELTAKSPERLESICRGWARCRAVAGVLYVAGPIAEGAVLRAVERAGADAAIAVIPLAAISGAGPAGARS